MVGNKQKTLEKIKGFLSLPQAKAGTETKKGQTERGGRGETRRAETGNMEGEGEDCGR